MTTVTSIGRSAQAVHWRKRPRRSFPGLIGALLMSNVIACVEHHSPAVAHQGDDGSDSAADDSDVPRPALEVPSVNALQGQGKGCDLSGRWIMTEHRFISVLGSSQVAVDWFYVEMTQDDEEVTMATAMSCGGTTVGLPVIEVQIDDSPAWPAYMAQVRYDGRQGRSIKDGDECEISFERGVLVRGATVLTYRDLSVPLPGVGQQADGTMPGWEDWDEDGHSGVTKTVTGTIWGSIYEGSRIWSEYDGYSPRDAGTFTLSYHWQHERVTLGFDPSPILAYEGVRAPNEAQQFVELTRLSPDQATDDDASKCESIRNLAPQLTPNASEALLR